MRRALRCLWALLASAFIFAALSSPGFALPNNAGGSAAQFLQLGAGARALGMGEAYGPVAEGPEAMYWNPAGLAQTERPEFSYSHVEMLRFIHHDYAAYAHPVSLLNGTIGASATLFYQDALTAVNNANQAVGSFSPHSEAFAFGYARTFTREDAESRDRRYFQSNWRSPGTYRPVHVEEYPWEGSFSAGLAFKMIRETLNTRAAGAIAADGGLLYRPVGLEGVNLSFAFRNLGSQEKFIQEAENLPMELDFGAVYDKRFENDQRLLPVMELALPYYGNPYAKLGIEYSAPVGGNARGALRFGYKTLPASDLSPLAGISFGVGVQYKKLSLDLGFQPMASLGELYRFSFNFRF